MPKRWVGGTGSIACPSRGQYIEGHVFDDEGRPQGTVFLEVKTLFGSGGSGRSILCNYMTASDPYYRYWVGTSAGAVTTVDGSYHLCRGDPTTCQGGPSGSQTVHLGTWRVWTESELVGEKADHLEPAAMDELLKYFKAGDKGPRSSKGGGLPWEDKPLRVNKPEEKKESPKAKPAAAAKEDEKKLERISRLQRELEALKASVGVEDEGKGKPKQTKKKTKRPRGNKGPDLPKKAFQRADLRAVPRKGDDDQSESSSYGSNGEEEEDESVGPDERKALRNIKDKGRRAARRDQDDENERRGRSRDRNKKKEPKGKKKAPRGKDRGPFGVAPSEDWDTRKELKDESSEGLSNSSDGSSFRKAPSSKSHHLRLVRYARRYPGRLAARLLRRMESATGFGGAETKPLQQKGRLQAVAHMYFLAIMTPHMRDKWTPRTQRELKVSTTLLDLMVNGQGPEAADIIAQRIKALEKSVIDGNQWRKARHLELVEPEDSALVDQGEEDMMIREAEREDKLRQGARWVEKEPWRKGGGKGGAGADNRRKGQEGAKGKGKKGNPLDRASPKKDENAA